MIGRNFLTTLERKRKLLERLQALEREIEEEQERLLAREREWALEALAATLEDLDLWPKVRERWEEIAREHYELWREIGLGFLIPEDEYREDRLRLVEKYFGDVDEAKLDQEVGRQEEQGGEEEAQPEEAQPRMGGVGVVS